MTTRRELFAISAAALAVTTFAAQAQHRTTPKAGVKVTQIRNATLHITYGGSRFLIDPMLSERHAFPGFEGSVNSEQRNPMVHLPMNFSNAGGWSMAFYGFAASLATPSTWSLSAVSVAVSARAVGRGGWPKVPPCWLMKYCLNNPCVSGC